jgi:hypothetical protein
MKIRPAPAFIARVLDALPADGSPISPRGVFVAIGSISTRAYVRTVLRQLDRADRIIGSGHPSVRVYRRIPSSVSVQRVPADGQSALAKDVIHECA